MPRGHGEHLAAHVLVKKTVALTHYSLTGESRGTSFCLELPTPGGFVNFSTVSVGKWLVLPLDCLLIYLRKKDPSRGGLGSFAFTPVCPRLWFCMTWTGFLCSHRSVSRFLYDDIGSFCVSTGWRPGFYMTTAGKKCALLYEDCTKQFQPVVDIIGAWYMTLI